MLFTIWIIGLVVCVVASLALDAVEDDAPLVDMLFLCCIWPISLPGIVGFYLYEKKKAETKREKKKRSEPFETHEEWVERTGIVLPSEVKKRGILIHGKQGPGKKRKKK